MIPRRQLPVHSPIDPIGVLGAAARSFFADAGPTLREQARAAVRTTFYREEVLLTDSGTSALVAALRLATPDGGIVALPAFACVDLIAAARQAGVRVALYDVDPANLGPDDRSLRRAVEQGASSIVVAHLFGFPADLAAVEAIAAPHGAVVIEDAAQGAFGTLHDRVLGSSGSLGVLSFGRGKGTNAAGGGALLAGAPYARQLAELEARLEFNGYGAAALAATSAQWVLGRPSLYALPSALPFLHLGEMVYHPAHEPREIARASAALVPRALALAAAAVEGRRARAARLQAAVEAAGLSNVGEIPGARAGFLRFPIVTRESTIADGMLGIVRPYPITLQRHEASRAVLTDHAVRSTFPGAETLASRLMALPLHAYVTPRDEDLLAAWLRGD